MATPRKLFQAIGATQQSARDAIGAISSGDVAGISPGPWASVLYVDNVRGNDSTAARGNQNLPFATIQAALNAAQTDDTVWLAPQRFTLLASLTIPATIVRLTITGTTVNANYSVGSTQVATTIIGVSLDKFNLNSATLLTRINFTNFNFSSSSAGFYSVRADSSLGANSQLSPTFNNVQGLNLFFKRIAVGSLYNSQGAQPCVYQGCLTVQLFNSQMQGDCTNSFDNTVDPATYTGTLVLQYGSTLGSVFSPFTLSGQGQLYVDESSTLSGGLKGSGLLAPVGSNAPTVVCAGYLSGTVDFSTAGSELPDTATALVFNFQGCRFVTGGIASPGFAPAGSSIIKFKVGGSAVNVQTVIMEDTLLPKACALTAGARVNILGRGSRWPSVVLATPDATGAIDPPTLTGAIDLSAGGSQAKTWAQLGQASFVRTVSQADSVVVSDKVQGANTVVSSITSTGITFLNTIQGANTAVNWLATWR